MNSANVLLTYVLLAINILCWVNAFSIVPQPQSLQTGTQTIQIDPTNFRFTTQNTSPILSKAIQRYVNDILFAFSKGNIESSSNGLYICTITVNSNDENLFLGVDESYNLNVMSSNALLSANTIYGAMRGSETFAQIVDWNTTSKIYTISRVPLYVQDNPRFKWRGLLIDTARHFLDIPSIKRQIDALSATKMNTLHWHVIDAQSFPIHSTKFPFLAEKGAYDPSATYSPADVAGIITYAQERGIRVVPEFDIPGHAASWGFGDPSLTVRCPKYEQNINNIPLDPTQQHTYDVVGGFLSEMASIFPDSILHVGGDEIVFGCWLTNPQILAWMSSHHMTTGPQLAQYFHDNLWPLLLPLNKTMVVWQDLFDNNLNLNPLNTIIEVWRSSDEIKPIVSAGFRTFLSAGWYLNEQVPKPNTIHGEYYDTWIDFYGNDPTATLNLTPAEAALVLGGEACMWGEQADSGSMDTEIWPRTAAVGERLWSAQSVVDVTSARARFVEHACRLRQRGVHAAPLAPGYCPLPTGA